MTDRAVSQAIGFVLIFAVVVAMVGLVGAVGVDQLETFRESQELQNAERSMLLLKANADEIRDGRTLARTGELDLDRGRIDVIPAGESRIRIRVENDTDTFYNETLTMRGLRYRLAGTTVGYEGGAVFRADGPEDVTTQAEPAFICTDDHAIVALVTIDGARDRQLGAGTASLTVQRNASTLEFPTAVTGPNSTEGRANVTVDIVDSPFEPAWERHFEDHDGWTEDSGEFVCSGPSDDGVKKYQVVRTTIDIVFTR